MTRRKRIILVAPCKEGQVWRGQKSHFVWPPYNLACVAACAPDTVEMVIRDEAIEPLDFDELAAADLVGVTSLTANAPQAYGIADRLRARGTKVILGGIHASFMPQEAIRHADSVCIGEAEGIFEQVCDDLVHERPLRRYYKAPRLALLDTLRPPRRDLLRSEAYGVPFTIMATRGCVYDCSFCSTTRFMGGKFRVRPVAEVAKEIAASPAPFFIFLDDLLHANKKYIRELLEAIAPLGKRWVAQTTINTAEDPELLRLTAKAGGAGCLLGIESLSPENIRDVKKGIPNKVELTADRIKVFHDAGLFVQGSFIFGLDGDTPDVFRRTVDFAFETKLEACNFAVLTPLPGTEVYTRLHAEGRITSYDWARYDKLNVVFEPRGMSAEVLQAGVVDAYREVYSLAGIWKRMPWFKRNSLLLMLYNLAYRRGVTRGWGVGGERAGIAWRLPFKEAPEPTMSMSIPKRGEGPPAPAFEPIPITAPAPAETSV